MHRLSTISILSTLFISLSRAQNATITAFLVDTDPEPLVASVVTANAATTSLFVQCPSGEDASDCGLGPGISVEQVSTSIWQASMTPPGESFSFSWSCDVDTSATTAVCVTSAGGESANAPGVATTTLSGTDVQFFPVTITAGQQQLGATGGASSGGSKSSGGSSSGSASTSKPTASGSSATSSGSTAKATSGSSSVVSGKGSLALSLAVVGLFALQCAF